MRRPIKFSPVRAGVDYTRGQAEGHYRRLNRTLFGNLAEHVDGDTINQPVDWCPSKIQ
jgi:hypothetical protein